MKGSVLDSNASFVVTLQGSGKSFSVQADETILDASLKAGIILAYGCKNGACGSCKGKILFVFILFEAFYFCMRLLFALGYRPLLRQKISVKGKAS
jgi:hypothetical protein